jgi:hypothetical protein
LKSEIVIHLYGRSTYEITPLDKALTPEFGEESSSRVLIKIHGGIVFVNNAHGVPKCK